LKKMSLFFGYAVPGLYNSLNDLRQCLASLDANSALCRAISPELDVAEANYTEEALRTLHALYENGMTHGRGPRRVCLSYLYKEIIIPLSAEAISEWKSSGASILHRFTIDDPNNRFVRIDRGILLTFLE